MAGLDWRPWWFSDRLNSPIGSFDHPFLFLHLVALYPVGGWTDLLSAGQFPDHKPNAGIFSVNSLVGGDLGNLRGLQSGDQELVLCRGPQ